MISEEGRGGGALYRINNIALETKGLIETVIVMPYSNSEGAKHILKNELEVVQIDLRPLTKSVFGLMKYLVFFLKEIWQLSRVINIHSPDIIHVNGSWQIKGVVASWIKGKKCIWHMNDTRQHALVRLLFRLLSSVPKAFIFASNRTLRYYDNHIIGENYKSEIVPAPVDTDKIVYTDRQLDRKKLKLVTVGYLNKNKGLDLVLETASLFRDDRVEFHIIGPTIKSQKSYTHQLLKKRKELKLNNVHFHGYKKITTEELSNYNVYFCSSTNEASPISVWEAMASGMPVISTDVGDVKQIIERYNCGYVLAGDTGVVASQLITKFLDMNQENYSKLSRGSRQAAVDTFDRKSIAKAYLRLYSEVMSEG